MADKTTSIFSVMSTPALKEAFKWHNVTLYCPENLMFIDRVDQAWRALFLRRHEAHETVSLARSIWDTFFSEEAQWEVSLNTPEHNRLKQVIGDSNPNVALDSTLFDRAYDLVVRDMSRSLANFQTTPFWDIFESNRDLIETIYNSAHPKTRSRRSTSMDYATEMAASAPAETRRRSESMGEEGSSESLDFDQLSRAEVLARIRSLYRTTQHVRLQRMPTGEQFQCLVGDQVRGTAHCEGETFYFCDRDGKILLNVPMSIIFEKDSAIMAQERRKGLRRRESSPAKIRPVKSNQDVGKGVEEQTELAKPVVGRLRRSSTNSGLKGMIGESKVPRSRRNSQGAVTRKAMTFHFKTMSGLVVGPMDMNACKMFWRFHLLDGMLEVSSDTGLTWEALSDCGHFVRSDQIASIDPTHIINNF